MASTNMPQDVQNEGIAESDNLVELNDVSCQKQMETLYVAIPKLAVRNLDIEKEDNLDVYMDVENGIIKFSTDT